eukprot:12562894-Heterocapsa_arctica.AAC.1
MVIERLLILRREIRNTECVERDMRHIPSAPAESGDGVSLPVIDQRRPPQVSQGIMGGGGGTFERLI